MPPDQPRPRIAPAPASTWDPDTRRLIESLEGTTGHAINVFRTIANHSRLFKRWMVFTNHILSKSTLRPREKELIILRVAVLCQNGYEWAHHVIFALNAGLTEDEVEHIRDGANWPGWSRTDAALLTTTDELIENRVISNSTWELLVQRWSREQLIDIVFTVGQYVLLSMALNSFRVQLEPQIQTHPSSYFRGGTFSPWI
jgi:4-carboxymuconolactone decarboxylase